MTPQGFNAVEICMFYIFLILTSVTTAFGVTETSLSDVESLCTVLAGLSRSLWSMHLSLSTVEARRDDKNFSERAGVVKYRECQSS